MIRNIVLLLFISLSFSACLKNSGTSDMCNYDPCGFKASDNEVNAVQTYLTNNNINAVKHCSGLFYQIVDPGTGKTPGVCNYVTVNYVGSLTNGNKFDESQPDTPLTYQLGRFITGWQNGIPLIKEGGRIRLFIPPSLGYGNQEQPSRPGYSGIPAGSILIFDVELKQVQ